MPGMIDAHWHTIFAGFRSPHSLRRYRLYPARRERRGEANADARFHHCPRPRRTSFALKQAIDEGLAVGPRIYPSGAMITAAAAMAIFVR